MSLCVQSHDFLFSPRDKGLTEGLASITSQQMLIINEKSLIRDISVPDEFSYLSVFDMRRNNQIVGSSRCGLVYCITDG